MFYICAMFFLLSKILAFLITPFTWIIGVLIFAYFTKNKRRRKKALLWALGLFLFFSNTIIFEEFMRIWEVDGKKYSDIETYDVGIVLGGMIEYNNDLERISFKHSTDRLLQAVRLYKYGKIKKILISGDSGNLIEDGLDEARELKQYLTELGIPSEDIITEDKSINTYENAKFTVDLLKTDYPQHKKFLLITSGFHLKRAIACFNKQGLEFDHFATDAITGDRYYTFDRIFQPKLGILGAWRILNHEIFGYLTYWFVGYI